LRLDRVHIAGRGIVDHLEEARETVAQVETASTTMADLENAAHFGVDLGAVVEIGLLPIDRVTRRCVETAFAHVVTRPWPRPGERRGATRAPRLFQPSHQKGRLRRAGRAPSGNARHATSRPWRVSRTSRRFPRSPHCAQCAPCPDTCRYIRASRRRSPL